MEIAFLLILLLLVVVVILPISAHIKASRANQRIDELSARVDPLEQEICNLRRELNQRGEHAKRTPEPETEPKSTVATEASKPVMAEETKPSPQIITRLADPRKQPQAKTSSPVPPPLPAVTLKPTMTTDHPDREATHSDKGFSFDRINWEQFMGVRLFAWLGGLALFLAAAFFVKYSFDQGLISPVMRVTLGFITGIGLVFGGIRMSQKKYKITADTLCATGVVILYAITFACRTVYQFPAFQQITTFLIMTLITGTAFLLAVRLNAMVVAVLGMLGGFLTPILVSTGHDNPVGLFTYIALLDIGLISAAFARRWNWLTFAAAICTALMQFGWVAEYFQTEKVFIALTVFLGFCGLFLTANLYSQRRGLLNVWLDIATLIIPAATLLFVPLLIADSSLGYRPGVIYSFLLGADLTVVGLAVAQSRYRVLNQISGGIVFLLLAIWTTARVNDALLFWALGGYFVFALLHTLVPVYLQRRNPDQPLSNWAQLFPIVTLLMTIIPMLKIDAAPGVIWSFVLIVDVLAILLAILAASLSAIMLVMVVTVGLAFLWVLSGPTDLAGILVVLGGLTTVFTLAGVIGGRKILDRQKRVGIDNDNPFLPTGWMPENIQQQIPAISAILPFLLLTIVTARLDLPSPTPVFAFALGLSGLILGLSKVYKLDWLPAIGLGCTFLVEHAWHLQHLNHSNAGVALLWYTIFCAVYLVYPFAFLRQKLDSVVPWGAAALSGPVHFLIILNLVQRAWPNDFMGIVPALFALPVLGGLTWLIGHVSKDHPKRNTLLAWFGGVSLLFITLLFPIQFDRQWLTISWALEGAALIWLFLRVPHQGLRYTGLVLLTVAFVRLALNVAVLDYSPRSELPILNWYLYTYGLVIASLFAAAKLLQKPNHLVLERDVRPWLITMGTVLAFFLLNIEIADFFSEPGQAKLMFKFSGNFGRDMTYTIGWALFAFVLMLIGILKQVRASRWAAIGLLGATLLKLFFHDLSALNQLYRVGALVGVAVIAIVVSFLYQKFLSGQLNSREGGRDMANHAD